MPQELEGIRHSLNKTCRRDGALISCAVDFCVAATSFIASELFADVYGRKGLVGPGMQFVFLSTWIYLNAYPHTHIAGRRRETERVLKEEEDK